MHPFRLSAAVGNYVLFPQSASAYGVATAVTADPLLSGGFATLTSGGVPGAVVAAPIAAAFFDLPDMSTPYTPGVVGTPLVQAANLTASLAVKSIMNEYATDASVSAKTDWTFSMPTRRYSVAMNYVPSTSAPIFSEVNGVTPWFHSANVTTSTVNTQQLCVAANAQTFFDREEGSKTSGAVFSPGNLSLTQFCGETSVLSFGDAGNSALSASVARQDTGASAFVNGWGNVSVDNGGRGPADPGLCLLEAHQPGRGRRLRRHLRPVLRAPLHALIDHPLLW